MHQYFPCEKHKEIESAIAIDKTKYFANIFKSYGSMNHVQVIHDESGCVVTSQRKFCRTAESTLYASQPSLPLFKPGAYMCLRMCN